MLGSKNEFVIIKAQTHDPVHGAELSVLPLSHPGAQKKLMFISVGREPDLNRQTRMVRKNISRIQFASMHNFAVGNVFSDIYIQSALCTIWKLFYLKVT